MRIHSFLVAATMLLISTPAWALSKAQTNLVPAPADCFSGPGFCFNVDSVCSFDNSECALGTMSAKSLVRLDGRMRLLAKIFGVTDAAGSLMTTGPAADAVDNLILKLTMSTCAVDNSQPACDNHTVVYVKVVLTNGRAILNLDLAPVFSLPVGSVVGLSNVQLLGVAPACTGDNSAAAIAARFGDANCNGNSVVRGSSGVITQ